MEDETQLTQYINYQLNTMQVDTLDVVARLKDRYPQLDCYGSGWGVALHLANQQKWDVVGVANVGQAENNEHLFTISEDDRLWRALPTYAPVYASVYDFENDYLAHHYESKQDLIDCIQELVGDTLNLQPNDVINPRFIDDIAIDALGICDWQNIETYILDDMSIEGWIEDYQRNALPIVQNEP